MQREVDSYDQQRYTRQEDTLVDESSEEIEILREEKKDLEILNTRVFALVKDGQIQQTVGDMFRNVNDIHQAKRDKSRLQR